MSTVYQVKKSCLRYVIPFWYEESFERAIENVNNLEDDENPKTGKRWERKLATLDGGESDLFQYVRDEFAFENAQNDLDDKKAGYMWLHWNSFSLKNKKNKRYARKHKNFLQCLYYYKEGASTKEIVEEQVSDPQNKARRQKIERNVVLSPGIAIEVANAGLALFRNGLGFLWYELHTEGMDSSQLVIFQNQVKELNRVGNPHFWVMPKDKDAKIETPFLFGAWICGLLDELKIRVHYFAQRKPAYEKIMKQNVYQYKPKETKEYHPVPDKALLFSYYAMNDLVNDSLKEREALAYHLTNGYTERYHFSDDTSADMKHPFGNVIFYATQEGVAYLAWMTNDNHTFFETSMLAKARNDYFTLYLKTLYQSYSLLLYAERIQHEISMDDKNQGKPSLADDTTQLLGEINLFLAKSMATSVSHIHHQSEFYVYLKQRLRVHEDVKSVTSGLDALASLQRKQNEEQAQKSSDQIQAIMGLFALLGISSALVDGFDFITRFFDGENWSQLGIAARCIESVFMAVILIVSVVAIHFAVKAIRNSFDGNIHKALFNWLKRIR